MAEKWTPISWQFTKQGKSLLTRQLRTLFIITSSQAYMAIRGGGKNVLCCTGRLLKTMFEMHIFSFIGRKCHNGQGLLWLHWDAPAQPLEPHPARSTCSTPKIGCSGHYLEQMGRDCLCVGRTRLCSSPKKTQPKKSPYDTWLITPVNKAVLQLQGYI